MGDPMMTPHQRGYPYVEIAPGGPFGALRNALLSDFPITRSTLWTAALLAGDAQADDLTRFLREIAEAAVETTWHAGGTRQAVCRGRMRVRLTARQAEPAPARKSP